MDKRQEHGKAKTPDGAETMGDAKTTGDGFV
jgi:hypothetical protein